MGFLWVLLRNFPAPDVRWLFFFNGRAKMAGTGRGGLMWAVCLDEKSQNAVYEALSKVAPQVWKTQFA